jgi:hypothetical protein
MAKQSITQLKNWFVTQAKPIQNQFWDWLDSFRHKDEKIAVDDLEPALQSLVQSIPDADTINSALATKVSKWQQWENLFVVKDTATGDLLLNVDTVNGLAQIGDFLGSNNSTFISVDDAHSEIVTYAANGIRTAGDYWRLSPNGDAKFANATITTLTSTMLKVNSAGKLVAAVAGTDYQTPIGYSPVNKSGDTMLGHLTLVGDAVNALHPITKSQFDNLQTGLSWKYSARASTVAALPAYTVSGDFLTLTATANGALALDGVTLVVGDRILVKNEAGAARVNNGAYTITQVGSVSQPYILTRTTAANTSDGLTAATFYVREGTIEANRIYAVNTNPVVLGTTQITFALVAGAGTYANGTGLDLTGNVFSIATAGVSNAMLAGGIVDAKISSAANWNNAYNSRISNFTTTGNSGAATFVGNVLNVPNYTIGGLGGLPLIGGTITNPVTIPSSNYNVPIAVVQGDYRRTGGALTFGTQNGTYTTGTYTGISPTGGNGSGLVVTVVVTNNNTATLTQTTEGSGYMVGDRIVINNTAIGGVSGTSTFTILSVNNAFTLSNQNAPASFSNYLMEANSGNDIGSAFTPIAKFNAIYRDGTNVTSPLLIGTSWTLGGVPLMALRFNNINQITFGATLPNFPVGLSSGSLATFAGGLSTTTALATFGYTANITTVTNAYNAIGSNLLHYTSYAANKTKIKGNVASLTITANGSGYTNGSYSNVAISGGSGTGLVVSFNVSGGIVTVTNIGTSNTSRDYIQGETVTASFGGGTGFTATVNLRTDPVIAFNANDIFNSTHSDPYIAYNGTPKIIQTGAASGDVRCLFWNPDLTGGLSGRNLFLWGVTGDALMCTTSGRAAIGTDIPHASALLTLSSTTRGFLPPRMTKTQRDAIASPATGLVIYQTDNTPGLRCYNGTNWMRYTETTD